MTLSYLYVVINGAHDKKCYKFDICRKIENKWGLSLKPNDKYKILGWGFRIIGFRVISCILVMVYLIMTLLTSLSIIGYF